MKLTKENFTRINSDINGNPRYYLPTYLAAEENARKIGGVKYRGKAYGPGWVFQSYEIREELEKLNELEGNKDEPKQYQRVRIIEATHVPCTNESPSKVKIYERARDHNHRQASKTFDYPAEGPDNVESLARHLLENSGFNIVAIAWTKESYAFMVNNWGNDYLEIKDIKEPCWTH